MNRDTFVITTTRVAFKAPEVAYDTVGIRASELPYSYRGEQISDFGEYDLLIHREGECDERVMLKLLHITTTVTNEQDTTLCEGKAYKHGDVLYYESTTIVDSVWVNRDTLEVAFIKLTFTAPEVEYDTVYVNRSDLETGYYYELANMLIYETGEYEYELIAEGECTRRVLLAVKMNTSTGIDDAVVVVKPRLVMIDGVIYVVYNGEYYLIDGRKVVLDGNK